MEKPVLWPRCDQETWSLTPPNRYIINGEFADKFQSDQISNVSDLKGSAFYKPFSAATNYHGAKILIERHRSRGIGDLLFLSGPLSFINHMSGGTAKLFVKTLVDRGPILAHHPALHLGCTVYGPTLYDTLPLYHSHWMIESVTEFDEEPDQANVYDVLYRQMGLDPAGVDPQFKRPSVGITNSDTRGLHSFFHAIWSERQVDLRSTPYYVVAPFSHGQTRSASYQMWFNLIQELAKKAPVVVLGNARAPLADTDIPVGSFVAGLKRLAEGNARVMCLLNDMPIRSAMMIISKAKCLFGLDSAPLYMAQAFRVPAVSLWGPHDPRVRIGYDKDYMDLAVTKTEACPNSPCFAYAGLPREKCPNGEAQMMCSVLQEIKVDDVLAKLSSVES